MVRNTSKIHVFWENSTLAHGKAPVQGWDGGHLPASVPWYLAPKAPTTRLFYTQKPVWKWGRGEKFLPACAMGMAVLWDRVGPHWDESPSMKWGPTPALPALPGLNPSVG